MYVGLGGLDNPEGQHETFQFLELKCLSTQYLSSPCYHSY